LRVFLKRCSRWTSPSRTRPCWSCRSARPRRRAGARRRSRRTGAIALEMREPHVVGSSWTSIRSLSAIGTPASGPRAPPSSSSERARASAWSDITCRNACTRGSSAVMRSRCRASPQPPSAPRARTRRASAAAPSCQSGVAVIPRSRAARGTGRPPRPGRLGGARARQPGVTASSRSAPASPAWSMGGTPSVSSACSVSAYASTASSGARRCGALRRQLEPRQRRDALHGFSRDARIGRNYYIGP
jgi:hypothetical protein